MNTQNSLSNSLNSYTEIIIKELRFKSYHFIELFIYFNNFIEQESINQDSFVTAQTTLLMSQEENEEEEIEVLSQKIFSVLSQTSEADIVSLSCYLKKISIATSPEFDVDVLFALLDKDNKGYIDYSDIETLISSFEDFINETNDWKMYENSFSGKKIIKRNLTQNHFFEALKKLFGKANKIIENRLNGVRKEADRSKEKSEVTKLSLPIIEGITVHNKNKATNSNPRSSKEENEKVVLIDQNDININEGESLEEKLFEKRKIEVVKKIKKTSFLYDILFDDFLHEISHYESKLFNKHMFIETLSEIISRKTSDLLESPLRKLSLSMLFQIINFTHNSTITFYEVIGGVLPLTKLSNKFNLMMTILKYPKDKAILILSGYMALYLNIDEVKDIHIFCEIIFEAFKEDNIKSVTDLFHWVYQGTTATKEPQLMLDAYSVTEMPIAPTNQDLGLIFKTIEERVNEVKAQLPCEIRSLSVLAMTSKLLKYSFLGVINVFQLSNFLNEIIGETYSQEAVKKKVVNGTMLAIEKNFDFSRNELIDIIHLHAFNMIFFSGKTIEKLQSLFLIHDIGSDEALEYEDFCEYLSQLFGFILKETKINWCDSKTISRIIGEYIISQVGKKITLTSLINVYENLASIFPKTKQ